MTPKGKPYPEGTLPGSYQDERGVWRAPDGSLLTMAWLVTPEQARQRRQREALQANHAKQGPSQAGPGLAYAAVLKGYSQLLSYLSLPFIGPSTFVLGLAAHSTLRPVTCTFHSPVTHLSLPLLATHSCLFQFALVALFTIPPTTHLPDHAGST
jgi:hypothetical protein